MAFGRPPAIQPDSGQEAELKLLFPLLTDEEIAAKFGWRAQTSRNYRARLAPDTMPAKKKSPGAATHGANDKPAGNDEGAAMNPQLTPA